MEFNPIGSLFIFISEAFLIAGHKLRDDGGCPDLTVKEQGGGENEKGADHKLEEGIGDTGRMRKPAQLVLFKNL